MNRWTKVHFQTHRVRAALCPTHCDGKLRSALTYYGKGEIGPPVIPNFDTRTVAERERDLYERALRGG